MNIILVFEDGDLIKTIQYKNKTVAKRQYNHFLKYGIVNVSTGEKILNASFELL